MSALLGLPLADIGLGLAVLVAAVFTLVAGARATQAMGFLVLGALITLVWLRLGSVDVALAEAGLGGGILGALLVWLAVTGPERADGHHRLGAEHAPRRYLRTVFGLVVGTVTAGATVFAWVRAEGRLPRWTGPLTDALPATGVTHEVTGVLLAFRAYDTLLESAVLMVAAVMVLTLGADGGLGQVRHPRPEPPPGLLWVVNFGAPVLLLFGLWLLFAGSSQPGGAFQAGAVFCALLILMHTAGVPMEGFAKLWLRPLLVVGVIAFIAAALVGPAAGEAWLTWHPSWAFALIVTVESLLTAGITAALFIIYLGLANPLVGTGVEETGP